MIQVYDPYPTGQIQKALNDYNYCKISGVNYVNEIFVPDGAILEGPGTLIHLPQNVHLQSEETAIIAISEVNDTQVRDLTLIGEADTHQIVGEEQWIHGYRLYGGNNNQLHNIRIHGVVGDGVLLKGKEQTFRTPPKNFIGSNWMIDTCGRNCVSVVDMNGGIIRDLILENAWRIYPKAGLGVEPDSQQGSEVRDLIINNVIINDCRGQGLYVWGQANPVEDVVFNNVLITQVDGWNFRISFAKNISAIGVVADNNSLLAGVENMDIQIIGNLIIDPSCVGVTQL